MVPGTPMVLIPKAASLWAPRKEPSPPITTIPSIPCFRQISAPFFWPSSVINSLHRAVYKNVPPRFRISHTLAAPKSTISSSRSPAYPFWIPFTRQPSVTAVRTTALTAAFIPGASPPLVSTPIVLIFLLMFKPPSLRTDNDFSE